MEEDLHKLATKQPYRYQRSVEGQWLCPPGDELTQTLGFSFRVCSSALLPRTYVDNLDFLTDYFISQPVIPERLTTLVRERVQALDQALVGSRRQLQADQRVGCMSIDAELYEQELRLIGAKRRHDRFRHEFGRLEIDAKSVSRKTRGCRGPDRAQLHTAERPHIFGAGSSTQAGREGYWLIDVEGGRIGASHMHTPGN